MRTSRRMLSPSLEKLPVIAVCAWAARKLKVGRDAALVDSFAMCIYLLTAHHIDRPQTGKRGREHVGQAFPEPVQLTLTGAVFKGQDSYQAFALYCGRRTVRGCGSPNDYGAQRPGDDEARNQRADPVNP